MADSDDYVVIELFGDARKVPSKNGESEKEDSRDDELEKGYAQVNSTTQQGGDSELPLDLSRVKKRLSSHILGTIEKLRLSPESYRLCLQLIHFSSLMEATVLSPISSASSNTDNIFTDYAKLYRRWAKSEEAWKIDNIMEVYDLEVAADDENMVIEHSMESESTDMTNPNCPENLVNDP